MIGTTLAHYRITAALGAGGMGEVYRARDTKLDRDVAVKVLPARLAESAEAFERLEREARVLASLNHPNVATLYGIETVEWKEAGKRETGNDLRSDARESTEPDCHSPVILREADGRPKDLGGGLPTRPDPSSSAARSPQDDSRAVTFLVMELLEGETLRERLATGALPVRKAVDIAIQVARGLAAAHDQGIVHRDLKPDNVMITPDGRVKILDFGLARQTESLASADHTSSPTVAHPTDAGTVLGTAGYMAPEQVRGETADQRSDIFSLGCVLYEMLTGRRAFAHPTAAETMTAILREDPLDDAGLDLSPALQRTVRHCLEKYPAERFQSARDLAFDLEAATDVTGRSAALPSSRPPLRSVPLGVGLAVTAATLAAGLLAGWMLGARHGPAEAAVEPSFTRLTFEQGTVWSARFMPDGETVVYAAAWNRQPVRLYFTRLDTPQSTPVTLPDASLLSVSPTGELAVSLGHAYEGWMGEGTLARAPLLGGGARSVLEGVREADWTPDGAQLAIVRRVEGRERLELPAGHVLYETAGYISHVRISPQGGLVAFADHVLWADNVGAVSVVDLAGDTRSLTGIWAGGVTGLAWAPSGEEIWFTASDGASHLALHAVDLEGRQRILLTAPTDVVLFDVSREGRLLLGRETPRRTVEVLGAGSSTPRDLTLRESSVARFMTPDGRTVLLSDQTADPYTAYLQRTDGSPAVRLGEGDGFALSPDGRWVVAFTGDSPPRILLHPTGPGESREVPNERHIVIDAIALLPDGKRLVVFGSAPGERSRGWVIDIDGGAARPITQEGVSIVWTMPAISPDGSRVVGQGAEGAWRIYPLAGGAPDAIPGVTEDDRVLQWADDGQGLFVGRRVGLAWQIRRVDLQSGDATPWTEIAPRETAGLRLSQVYLTPNGRFWAYSYSRLLTDLYVAEDIR